MNTELLSALERVTKELGTLHTVLANSVVANEVVPNPAEEIGKLHEICSNLTVQLDELEGGLESRIVDQVDRAVTDLQSDLEGDVEDKVDNAVRDALGDMEGNIEARLENYVDNHIELAFTRVQEQLQTALETRLIKLLGNCTVSISLPPQSQSEGL